MLKFSKKVEYAIISLLHMSRKDSENLTSARELSDRYQIPQELLGKILQRLTREGYIRSVQGVKGGYQLNFSREEISINNLVHAIDGPLTIVSCTTDGQYFRCGQHSSCSIKHAMAVIQTKLEKFLDTISLEDISREMATHKIPIDFN